MFNAASFQDVGDRGSPRLPLLANELPWLLGKKEHYSDLLLSYTRFWIPFSLDWLRLKVIKTDLLCYLTHIWGREWDGLVSFLKIITAQVKSEFGSLIILSSIKKTYNKEGNVIHSEREMSFTDKNDNTIITNITTIKGILVTMYRRHSSVPADLWCLNMS